MSTVIDPDYLIQRYERSRAQGDFTFPRYKIYNKSLTVARHTLKKTHTLIANF